MTEDTECAIEMPKYTCHKQVWALKISNVNIYDSDGSGAISFEDSGYAPIDLPGEYFRKHEPEAGGYYVVYSDGYKSFSPAEAFEEGYTKL